MDLTERIETVRRDMAAEPVRLCPERAYLITKFAKEHDDPSEPVVVRQAQALAYLLERKQTIIFPGELIVGNAGTSRKCCIMQPELASAFMSQELLWIDRRKTNPFEISLADRLRLITRVLPYWMRRSMPSRMFSNPVAMARYMKHQMNPTFYLINEAGGIGHFLPDYEKMLKLGTRGYVNSIKGKRGDLHKAARIVCQALDTWAGRMADEADRQAAAENGPERRAQLEEIARTCRRVPAQPAETFREALQSLWLTHLGVMLESLNSAVSFGRIDQYLYPYYKADVEAGRITSDEALELLLAFSAKATEHVMLLSERISQYHGGHLVVQAAIVGGTDAAGADAVNDLTWLLLDVMERHHMRDPNYQARVHRDSPDDYLERALDVARQGHGVPALFNDEAVVPSLVAHGYPVEVARGYGIVGCVEPSIPGRSFLSTDAGLFNLPICLELALNNGRRMHQWGRATVVREVSRAIENATSRQMDMTEVVRTGDPARFESMDDVMDAFRAQLDYHPTPLSSMLVEGCLESGKDLTEGGATYNSSGIQGVGVADVADSLAALDTVVFRKQKYTMAQVAEALRNDFAGRQTMRAELSKAPKFGNDEGLPDRYADLVVHMFHDSLARHTSVRGGAYLPGFYSVTCHVAFGELTAALPSGRKAGEAFASGIGPACGTDKAGPTAMLSSVAAVDSSLMANGNALNMRFDPADVAGEKGLGILKGLVKGFFERGGLEVQLNVLDPEMLEDARTNPGKYPDLVVRVAGYCAYFDDLPDTAKAEIIKRTRLHPA
jgi:formate C-acetyltransferase